MCGGEWLSWKSSSLSCPPHLKCLAAHHTVNKVGPAVMAPCGLMQNFSDCRLVVVFDSPAQTVGEKFLGNRGGQLIGLVRKNLSKFGRSLKLSAVGEDSRGIDRRISATL